MGKWKVIVDGYDVALLGYENVLKLGNVKGCTTLTMPKSIELYTLQR